MSARPDANDVRMTIAPPDADTNKKGATDVYYPSCFKKKYPRSDNKKRFESSPATGGKHKPTQTALPRSLSRDLARTGSHHHRRRNASRLDAHRAQHYFRRQPSAHRRGKGHL